MSAAAAADGPVAVLSASSGPIDAATVEAEEERAWWDVLKHISSSKGHAEDDAQSLVALLEHAQAAVSKDKQWNCSGVPGLLQRAVEQAKRGSQASARSLAATVVDFHLAALRYASQHQAARSSPQRAQPLCSAAGAAVEQCTAGTNNNNNNNNKNKRKASDGATNSSSSTSSDVSSSVGGTRVPSQQQQQQDQQVLEDQQQLQRPTRRPRMSALDRLASVSSEVPTPSSASTGLHRTESPPAATSAGTFSVPEPPSKRRGQTVAVNGAQQQQQPQQQPRRQQATHKPRQRSCEPVALVVPVATQVVTAASPRPLREGRLHMPPPLPLPLLQPLHVAQPQEGPAAVASDPSATAAAAAGGSGNNNNGPSSGCSSGGHVSSGGGSGGAVQGQQGHQQGGGTAEWTGVVALMQEDGARASDLCHAVMQLPRHAARCMPKALHLTHLVQRRGVMLGQYQVVRTAIKKANMRQMSRLRSMAQHELVAVSSLDHVHIIVVPYMDAKGDLKLVSFVLGPAEPSQHPHQHQEQEALAAAAGPAQDNQTLHADLSVPASSSA